MAINMVGEDGWNHVDLVITQWRVCRRLVEGCASISSCGNRKNNQTRGEKYMGHQGSGEEFDTPRNSP
jgi:hypothetical protein